eukprot:TRINITY_DN26261_c0_g1_i6.p2 TRINITY_DN26261_c0_g1~~TRINITY_DN26261_c0_g1_i6.p2  ORF type:complete len:222 (-),score=6.59 TRINITY_DN26261_c0_g1_i6:264-929(-)
MEILEAYKLKDLQQRDRPINLHTKYNQTNNYNRYHRHNNFLVNFQDKRVLIVSQQKFFNNNSFSDGQVFQSKLILPNQKNQIDVIQAANCQQEHPEISLNQQQSVENEQFVQSFTNQVFDQTSVQISKNVETNVLNLTEIQDQQNLNGTQGQVSNNVQVSGVDVLSSLLIQNDNDGAGISVIQDQPVSQNPVIQSVLSQNKDVFLDRTENLVTQTQNDSQE